MCQFIHPWTWLTTDNNAAALSTIIAGAGLLGLWRYVKYTRRLMELSESANRAAVMPVLYMEMIAPSASDPRKGVFALRNLGMGPALQTAVWAGYDYPDLKQFGTFMTTKTNAKRSEEGILPPDRSADRGRAVEILLDEYHAIYVAECTDVAEGKHQFQLSIHNGKVENRTLYQAAEGVPLNPWKRFFRIA